MKITATIITKNEERNIGRCLKSLQGIVDEVVVVDTFSEDQTPIICADFGAVFIEKEWLGYAATKNFANEQASHSYILSLDADEALSDELRKSILAIKSDLRGVYEFNRLAFYCGKAIRNGGWYPDRKIRLFPKGKACWEGAFVHEELQVDPGQMVQRLEGDLLHYTYYSLAEHRERARKYADLAAQRIANSGKKNLFWKRWLSPVFRFFKMYFLKTAFLDGKAGYHISLITAQEVAMKYRKATDLRKAK